MPRSCAFLTPRMGPIYVVYCLMCPSSMSYRIRMPRLTPHPLNLTRVKFTPVILIMIWFIFAVNIPYRMLGFEPVTWTNSFLKMSSVFTPYGCCVWTTILPIKTEWQRVDTHRQKEFKNLLLYKHICCQFCHRYLQKHSHFLKFVVVNLTAY